MRSEEVASALLAIGAVGFQLEAPLTFKSGILSPVYVDNRRLPFYPQAWRIVIDAFADLIAGEHLPLDVIAGVAVGGVPHSAALAYRLRVPSVFVRKEAKEHGRRQLVEGGDVQHRRVLLIEDLVTTGSSSLSAVAALRESGALVGDVLAIVQYGFREASDSASDAAVRIHTLTDFPTILTQALRMGQLTLPQADVIARWLRDPHHWTPPSGRQP